jgi:hypothetical protein
MLARATTVLSIAAVSIAITPVGSTALLAQARPPVIDVHMHALAANAQGPPPLGMCTPMNPFPTWDQRLSYTNSLQTVFKKPSCPNPVWSPSTDEDLIAQTIDAIERLNVTGVLSGTSERVDLWMKRTELTLHSWYPTVSPRTG